MKTCASDAPIFQKLFYVWVPVIVLMLFYLCLGWGHWGYSVTGDASLDLSDALRIHQGDIPYSDFLPCYGVFYSFLVAPLFNFQHHFFTALWISTFLLILVQLVMLYQLIARRADLFWTAVFMILLVTCMVFAPTNSKFILGYSPSGFLASLLLTTSFWILFRFPVSDRTLLGCGLILGIMPFTKVDVGIASIGLTFLLLLIFIKKYGWRARFFLLGYIAAWGSILLLLLAYGAKPSQFISVNLEVLQQTSLFRDENFALRIRLVLILWLSLVCAWSFRATRVELLKINRRIHPWIPLLLPACIFFDAYRTRIFLNPLKSMVGFNWFWLIIFILVSSKLFSILIRHRSIRPLYLNKLPLLVFILALTGFVFLRAYNSGWFPLGYYQPFLILLSFYWLVPFHRFPRFMFFRMIVLLGLCIQVVLSAYGCLRLPEGPVWVSTPFGKVGLSADEAKEFAQLTSLAKEWPSQDSLVCTYQPSYFVLTGMRSANFFTYFNRLGSSKRYESEREKSSLELISKRQPLYIIQAMEKGPVHRRFGTDYGFEILSYIRSHYQEIQNDGHVILWKKKD